MTKRTIRAATCVAALLTVSACGTVNNLLESRSDIDYKSAAKAPTTELEIPPDLTQLSKDNRYSVPQSAATTFSAYSVDQGVKKPIGSGPEVLPVNAEMRVERAGSQRWLVVNQPPEKLFPVVREFWQDLGFLIQTELPEAGILETDWAENRAKIPQDFVRNTLGKVFDSIYSTGERDKFRTRLERTAQGGTEVYISHRGMQETVTGPTEERSVWTARKPDPELEAEFLRRLMVRLGTDTERAKETVAATPSAPPKAQIAGNTVTVEEPFDRAWRRVGLALDRVGFTVEDRDRQQGLYFVRYVDPNVDGQSGEKKGFFGRLFGSGSNHAKVAAQYRVAVKAAGETTQISVQGKEGETGPANASDRILALLHEQLK